MAAGRFDRRHWFSVLGVLAGTVLAWGLFLATRRALPELPATDAAERLAHAAGLLAWPAALILVLAVVVAAARFLTGAFDPLADPESRFQRVTQRVLSNTVEQSAVFGPLLLAGAATADPAAAPVLTSATLVFVVGRVLFWAGYLLDPLHRATGMVMTLNVNAGLLGYVLWRLALNPA